MENLPLRAGALIITVCAVSLLGALSVRSVSAHVHAITPLNECSVDNAEHSGGRVIGDTPASVDNGGPIQNGPIPLNTGNASFDPENGAGNHADPHCP